MNETPGMPYPWFEWARLAALAVLATLVLGGALALVLSRARGRRRSAGEGPR